MNTVTSKIPDQQWRKLRQRRLMIQNIIQGGNYIGLILLSIFTLFPILWLVVSSLKGPAEIFSVIPTWIPRDFTLRNYVWALGATGPNLPVFMKNTLLASTFAALLTGGLSALAAYALSRFTFPGRRMIGILLLLFQMFKGPLVIVTWYRLAWNLGILDRITILVLAYAALGIPICTWLLIGFFKSIPEELDEAAMVDGCSRFKALYKVVLPVAAPGIAAIVLFAFILAWNDYIYALSLTSSARAKTIQVVLSEQLSFFGQTEWGGIMAAGVITTIPVVVLFLWLERYLVSGLSAGAVKG